MKTNYFCNYFVSIVKRRIDELLSPSNVSQFRHWIYYCLSGLVLVVNVICCTMLNLKP